MILFVTTVTATILTVLYVFLGLRVINMRRKGIGPSVGMSDNERFVRAVRAHANLGEYAPLFLILLGLYEFHGGYGAVLMGIAIVFVLGRLMHAVGFGFLGKGPWRTLGMVATNAALLTLALVNVLIVLRVAE